MTLSPELSAPLLTDADVHARVEALIGRATQDRCVWLILVDGDRRQVPVIMPLEGSPRRPEPRSVEGLRTMLAHLPAMLATDAGSGSCVFVYERLGADEVQDADEQWADALTGASTGAGFGSLGVFVSTPAGTRRLR